MPTCESCGREEREVTKVQRVYLLPHDSPGPDATQAGPEADATPTPGDIEMWCASCRATFPHTLIEET